MTDMGDIDGIGSGGGTEVMSPYSGFQDNFVRSACDVVVGGGSVGVGKSVAAWFSVAEDFLDGEFRGCFLRNNIDDLKAGGGLLDIAEEVFGSAVKVVRSDNPRVEYIETGAVVEVTHVADQSRVKVEQRFKGRQLDKIYFDEGTGFTWDTFVTIATRNRGRSGRNPQILITTNPKRKHWLRKMVDWYLTEEGVVDLDREGVVRYFFVDGVSVDDVVWGNSKEEVYRRCKGTIDRLLRGVYGREAIPDGAWRNMIKSFTYYQGRMAENRRNMERNAGYIGSVAMAGGANALNYLEGNWNADPDDENGNLLTFGEIAGMCEVDEQRNGDLWVTCDLADTGSDNFVCLAWDGLHVVDIHMMNHSTPRQNAEVLRGFAMKNRVGEGHIIFDAVRAMYMKDYIPGSVPFVSGWASRGKEMMRYAKLKDCCYGKLIYLVKNGLLSLSEGVSRREYSHANVRTRMTVFEEIAEELKVVRFMDAPNGRLKLMNKKEMNRELGKGRSMDVCDCLAMRMYPLLDIVNGCELESFKGGARSGGGFGYDDGFDGENVNIYDFEWF